VGATHQQQLVYPVRHQVLVVAQVGSQQVAHVWE
jgi:hypothetical protein